MKTPKGTDLPLLNLRGKDYLEVKYRLVWFREERPTWSIETSFVERSDRAALARAEIRDEGGRIVATSHKFENVQGFPDFLEKAETGAIGRALALIGYGTQFCADELDEGDRIVDSPAESRKEQSQARTASDPKKAAIVLPKKEPAADGQADPGDFVIPFGKKFKGKKVRDLTESEAFSYLAYIEADSKSKGNPLSFEAKLLKRAIEMYFARDKVVAPPPENDDFDFDAGSSR
jgi:hypothetical protein